MEVLLLVLIGVMLVAADKMFGFIDANIPDQPEMPGDEPGILFSHHHGADEHPNTDGTEEQQGLPKLPD